MTDPTTDPGTPEPTDPTLVDSAGEPVDPAPAEEPVPVNTVEEVQSVPEDGPAEDTVLPHETVIPIESVGTTATLGQDPGVTAVQDPTPYIPGEASVSPPMGNPTTPVLSEPTQKSLDVLAAMDDVKRVGL